MKAAEKVQKEFAGTESKAETEAMLRKAMADYEEKQFVGKAENITVGDMLDMWVEEELKPGNLSNGTVMSYQGTVNRIKQYPIGKRKLKTVTADHLQAFIDFLSYGGTNPDGTTFKAHEQRDICSCSRRCCKIRSALRYSRKNGLPSTLCSM